MVGRPGLATWGEIVDSSVLDVSCEVTPAQGRLIEKGQPATVRSVAGGQSVRGEVASISTFGSAETGKLSIRIRVDNGQGRLRCYEPVRVSFDKDARTLTGELGDPGNQEAA